MLPTHRSARRKPAKNIASALAMVLAFAGGTMAVNGAFASAALAQEYSDAFVTVYQPVQVVVNDPASTVESMRVQFPAIVAAARNADEKYAAGQLLYAAGNRLTDRRVQLQGMQLQIESGQLDAATLPQAWATVGNLAYELQDYATARPALEQAVALGFSRQDAAPLIAESMFQLGENAAGLDVLSRQIREMAAAGTEVPQEWLLRGLQVAYTNNMAEPAGELAEILVSQHTSQRSWMGALQVINAIGNLDDQSRLDLMRLMRLTDTLSDVREYELYVEVANPRIRASEVDQVLASGVAGGQLTTSDTFYRAVKEIVDARLGSQRAEAMEEVAEAQGDPTGETALIAGDLLYSLGDFAEAEAMYELSLEKGGVETEIARTRLGMSQVHQGKFFEAQATFEQVSGPREIVARMWSAYAEAQSA